MAVEIPFAEDPRAHKEGDFQQTYVPVKRRARAAQGINRGAHTTSLKNLRPGRAV